MDFYEVVGHVLALLQRQGRVSYRALKRQFGLDDAFIEDLKEELLYTHASAVQADERGFTWTGATEERHGTTRPPAQISAQPSIEPDQPPQAEPPPPAHHTPDAERRQLTVMFCDLVDSTRLSSQLDPEDWRDVVRAYQRVCTGVIQRYDGYIAQLLGDGLLVYFGYPQAHEDDAQRAVRTGLGILEAMGDLNKRLEHDHGITLALRLGMHTGLVVVGAMSSTGRHEQLALGETPNIAARIQGLAAPNAVVISDATHRLVQGYFASQDLGAQILRGVTESMRVYHVLSTGGATSRLDVAQPRGLTPLVGRESEVTLLLERWEQVKAGHGHVVLLTGDAGIGKSRLVQVLKEHVTNEPHVRWECRSLPYYQNTALYPIVDLIQRTLRWQPHHTSEEKLATLVQELSQYRLPVEESVQLFAPLLSLPLSENVYPPLNLSPERMRQRTLEALVAILLEQAERYPVLFIVEDLHWTDPTTLELLNLVLDQTPTASLLTLLTCRPHFQPAWHHRSYLTEITVNRLSHAQAGQIVAGITDGKTFPAAVLQQIIEKTDGVPLFVEEITKAILESGHLKAVDGRYELTGSLATFAIPATLQDSLMARLDRLVTAKAVAQYAAVIGRQFSYELLQAISQLDEATLQRELGRLVEAEIVYQRGLPPQATYVFKHALIQDAAYESLLKSTRQHYHQRIAHVLEEQFPETIQTQPELLAHHCTEAGRTEKAVHYWHQAGKKAVQRSAHVEAIAHLTKGRELLKALPPSSALNRQELALQLTLALAFHAIEGQASHNVERTYLRARELCELVDDRQQLFHVLVGLGRCYGGRGQRQKRREFGDEVFRLAQRLEDPLLLLEAHMVRGTFEVHEGELVVARNDLEQAITLYDPKDHHIYVSRSSVDPGVNSHSRLSWTLWFLGYPRQALDEGQKSLALARQLDHANSRGLACDFAAILYQLCGAYEAVHEQVETAMVLATEHDLRQWKTIAAILRGWYLACVGQSGEGIAQMQQGLTVYRASGTNLYQEWFLALLAEAYGKHGHSIQGLEMITEALTLVLRDEGFHCWDPELHRLKGVLLLQLSSDNQAEAETCFHHAITIAQKQSAKSLELRAATSLARLWHQQGKRQEAYELLVPVYNWFTEGFDTADLKEAKALLDELEDGR